MTKTKRDLRSQIIQFLKENQGKTYKQKVISQKLGVQQNQYVEFKQLLRDLSETGKIQRYRKGQYGYPQEKEIVEGRLVITSKGFGFVLQDEETDIFISYDNLGSAIDGDIVQALVFKKSYGKNPEGKILEVLERTTENIVGIFREQKTGGLVYPEDDRLQSPIYIPPDSMSAGKNEKRPKDGQVVVARLAEGSDPRHNPQGDIMEILGDPDAPKMDLKIVAKSKNLDLDFPEAVKKEAASIREVNWKQELKRRLDLRDELCFTIDPADAKDFDDAVSLKQLENGRFELGVHIADVSHYIQQGSDLDREAWRRGTSVYFVQHVIPMLPERLSNELCSLRPDEDKLTYSVIMELDSSGQVHNYDIRESVIRSKRRYSYEMVEEIIKGGDDEYANTIHLMFMLSMALRRKREEWGSIDFDIPEPIFSLDENGVPYEVRPSQRLNSHRLIEEFMLCANRVVAEHIEKIEKDSDYPFVYRIHEQPNEEDVQSFLTILKNLGVSYQVHGKMEPQDFRNVLEIVENLEFRNFIEKVALRSMMKAKYSPVNKEHFGLAFKSYTHFTSPIRRYPDLVVHRLLKDYLSNGKPKNPEKVRNYLEETCENSSAMERNALEAEREYAKIKSIEFLAQKEGETFEGVISGVTNFGCFVELTHYLVEGLVPIADMNDDYYVYDKENYRLTGKHSGKVYRLGDPVKIKVRRVSVEAREADLIFVE